MILTKTHKIIIGVIIIAILFGVYVMFDRKAKKSRDEFAKIDNALPTATTTDGSKIVGNTGQYKIEQVAIPEVRTVPQPIPDLNRSVPSVTKSMPLEALSAVTTKIHSLQASLKNDPMQATVWIDLGIYQKMVGDYEGAKISWQYVTRLAPSDYVAYGNLGDLYAYFLKDNGMAETYFKKAIEKGPTQVHLYMQLISFYRDVFKDTDKAKAIVAQGLAKIPGDPNLLQLQASMK